MIRAAAALFRRHGYAASGVDAVMASANLTAGGFYSHFRSKQDLLANALDEAFRKSRKDWPESLDRLRGLAWVSEFASFYLSEEHRDAPERGCPMPSLTAEIWRNGKASRKLFERQLRGLIDTVAERTDSAPCDRARAISAIALSVGGLMLARAANDGDFSREILKACREALVEGFGAEKEH